MSLHFDTPERLARFLVFASEDGYNQTVIAQLVRKKFPSITDAHAAECVRNAAAAHERAQAADRAALEAEAVAEEHRSEQERAEKKWLAAVTPFMSSPLTVTRTLRDDGSLLVTASGAGPRGGMGEVTISSTGEIFSTQTGDRVLL